MRTPQNGVEVEVEVEVGIASEMAVEAGIESGSENENDIEIEASYFGTNQLLATINFSLPS